MPDQLEGPDDLITLRRAAELAGLAPGTLGIQARRGKLRYIQPGGERLTTRRWLHDYIMGRDNSRGGKASPLPPNYIPPE